MKGKLCSMCKPKYQMDIRSTPFSQGDCEESENCVEKYMLGMHGKVYASE